MGWRNVLTKYCQIIRPVTTKDGLFIRIYLNEKVYVYDVILYFCIDKSTIEVKIFKPTNWRKDDQPLLRAACGKLGNAKHGFKLHFFGGISRKILTPLIVFKGKMQGVDLPHGASRTRKRAYFSVD